MSRAASFSVIVINFICLLIFKYDCKDDENKDDINDDNNNNSSGGGDEMIIIMLERR